MENPSPSAEVNFDEVKLNTKSKIYLKEIANWSTFFAVLGFILTAFVVIASISLLIVFATVDKNIPDDLAVDTQSNPFAFFIESGMAFGSVICFVYLLLALLYFFPSFYLMKAAQSLKSGIVLNNELALERGFQNLKSVFKFWGIFSIVTLILYALMFVAAISTSLFV